MNGIKLLTSEGELEAEVSVRFDLEQDQFVFEFPPLGHSCAVYGINLRGIYRTTSTIYMGSMDSVSFGVPLQLLGGYRCWLWPANWEPVHMP